MFRSLHRMVWALALTVAVGLAATSAIALDSGWPRTLPVAQPGLEGGGNGYGLGT